MELEATLFFFQAEDGIRDHCVTGVQTCALPILGDKSSPRQSDILPMLNTSEIYTDMMAVDLFSEQRMPLQERRSEERRVGKSVDLGGRGMTKKKIILSQRTSNHYIKKSRNLSIF